MVKNILAERRKSTKTEAGMGFSCLKKKKEAKTAEHTVGGGRCLRRG